MSTMNLEEFHTSDQVNGKGSEESKNVPYKTCFVPMCTNTTIKTPDKVFFRVPENHAKKTEWFKVARRADPPTTSKYFCCQDHFDLKDDMAHFLRFKMFGGPLKLKPDVLPHKFLCQPNRALQCLEYNRGAFKKLNQKRTIEEMILEQDQQKGLPKENRSPTKVSAPTKSQSVGSVKNNLSLEDSESEMEVCFSASESILSDTHEDNVQDLANLPQQSPRVRSEDRPRAFGEGSIMMEQIEQGTFQKMVSVETQVNMRKLAAYSGESIMGNILPNQCDSQVQATVETAEKACSPVRSSSSNFSSNGQSKSSPSKPSSGSLYIPSSVDTGSSGSCHQQSESFEKTSNNEMKLTILNVTRYNIMKDSKRYVGISEQCMAWLTKLLLKHSHCTEDHIHLTLTKIRLGDTFERLGDMYGISQPQASRIFHKTVRILSHLLKELIYQPSKIAVQKNLSIPFRAYYNSVYVLIDAFEIQIQKPSNPILQVMTWSEYKKCNTIKYIIACTADGLIVFISKGYGGRISDMKLFEDCDIMKILPEGCAVMADRGFKQIEGILQRKGCKLIRPPSVSTTEKPTRAEVLETKRIASLRIHVERLIRRVREYGMLKPHSCLDLKMVPVVDDIMYTACGLINLQNPLIRS